MAEAWGYTPEEAVTDDAGFSDQQRKKFGDVIPAEALTGGILSLKLATAYAADTVDDTGPVSTEPTLEPYDIEEPLISIEEELAAMERFVDWQRGREVSDMANEVLRCATGDQPQQDAEESSTFRNLATKGNSCLQDLLQAAGRPGAQHCQQASPCSRSHDLESLGSELDQVITDYNRSFNYADRAALDLAVQDVLDHCLTPAVRAAKPLEVWVLENHDAIMRAFKPMQGTR